MSKIKTIFAREILDSRGDPTVETTVILSDGASARSSVPSGSSKGTYEAMELRDNDKSRLNGKGVLNAVSNVNTFIAPKLLGMDAFAQQKIDKAMIELDGTQNKGRLGSNAILSISQAVAKASSRSSLLPLAVYLRQFISNNDTLNRIPTPMFNLIEGGRHSHQGAINFQEILLVPATSKTFSESLELGIKVFHSLKGIITDKMMSTLSADEGGFSPQLSTNQEAINMLKSAVERAGFSFALDAFIGLDVAANSILDGKKYRLLDRTVPYSSEELVDFYDQLVSEFSIIYLEDPLAEDDWEGWKKLYNKVGTKTVVCGDDLVTTNPYRLQLAIDNNVLNGIIIKPNQIGTVTEALAVAEMAKYKKYKITVSHRSGETSDDFIADFATAIGADNVKFGAPARERVIKYNRLLEIEKELQKI